LVPDVILVAYTRVSTTGQAVDGFGLDSQRAAIAEWATKNDHEVIQWCEDAGVSGTTNLAARLGLQCALASVADGTVDGMVVARLDRLARQLTLQEVILASLWHVNAVVFSADIGEIQTDDPSDPMRTAMRQMAGVFAQLDRANVVNRLAAGRKAKAAAGGKAVGAYPYGWGKDGTVPEEQKTIALIRAYRETYSLEDVANILNTDGIRPRHAAAWTKHTVRAVADPGL
jgi:DNA invertase Pin-like site-specific DNA recombinase